MDGMHDDHINFVIGSDSMVGHALIQSWQRAGKRVVGTTRRCERVSDSTLYLDLTNVDNWPYQGPVSVAVICAAMRDPATCMRDPDGSRRINVHGTVRLVDNLAHCGAFIIYLSSNMVFNGDKPFFTEEEPFSPVTEYGRQKAEVERQIRYLGKSLAVIRLTRILGPVFPLFAEWTKRLERGEAIQPFEDLTLAPVPLNCVTSIIRLIADSKLPGVWHISGDRDISYAEAARLGARWLAADECLVQPVLSSQKGYLEPVRPNTTLNTDRLRREFGIQPPDVMWTLEKAFTHSEVLGMR